MAQSPKYLTYLTSVLGIKIHTYIIPQNLNSLQRNPAEKINVAYIFQNHYSSIPIMNSVYMSDELAY